MTLTYPIASNTAHPPRLSPAYKSTVKRSPSKPLIIMRHTLSELTGPVYGHETVRESDHDLTTQHKGEPLDPNFTGAGRAQTDAQGYYRFVTVKPGAYPWGNHHNAWRPAHIHFSVFGHAFISRLVTQMYFPGDPLFQYYPLFNSVPDEKARLRMVSSFDLENTQPEWALCYRFNIVLRGSGATPMETK